MKRKNFLLPLVAAICVLATMVPSLFLWSSSHTAQTTPPPSQSLNLATDQPESEKHLPIEGEYYYDLENVILYLELYHTLPDNYITKNEAKNLGWTGGSVEKYQAGSAIGGDRFGNREGQLPTAAGRKYTECDLNTLGQTTRGTQRLCFSNDGLYFYTSDHYEHFTQYVVTADWEVIPQ